MIEITSWERPYLRERVKQRRKLWNGKGRGTRYEISQKRRLKKKRKILVKPSTGVRTWEELTMVASCFWLATFLILPMLTIRETVNHEEAQQIRRTEVSQRVGGGRNDRAAEIERGWLMTFLVLCVLTKTCDASTTTEKTGPRLTQVVTRCRRT